MSNTTPIEYSDSKGTRLVGQLAQASGSTPAPGILVVHPWTGLDDFIMEKASLLAQMGYTALAVDLYGDGNRPESLEDKQAMLTPLVEDRALVRDRMTAALDTLKAQSGVDTGKLASMGYCLGGMSSLELARSGADIRGIVSFHGLLATGSVPNEKITARILVLHGEADPMIPRDQVSDFMDEMNDAGCDWQLHSYGHAAHSFTFPLATEKEMGMAYDADADRRSWQAMQNFFDEIFA